MALVRLTSKAYGEGKYAKITGQMDRVVTCRLGSKGRKGQQSPVCYARYANAKDVKYHTCPDITAKSRGVIDCARDRRIQTIRMLKKYEKELQGGNHRDGSNGQWTWDRDIVGPTKDSHHRERMTARHQSAAAKHRKQQRRDAAMYDDEDPMLNDEEKEARFHIPDDIRFQQ